MPKTIYDLTPDEMRRLAAKLRARAQAIEPSRLARALQARAREWEDRATLLEDIHQVPRRLGSRRRGPS